MWHGEIKRASRQRAWQAYRHLARKLDKRNRVNGAHRAAAIVTKISWRAWRHGGMKNNNQRNATKQSASARHEKWRDVKTSGGISSRDNAAKPLWRSASSSSSCAQAVASIDAPSWRNASLNEHFLRERCDAYNAYRRAIARQYRRGMCRRLTYHRLLS